MFIFRIRDALIQLNEQCHERDVSRPEICLSLIADLRIFCKRKYLFRLVAFLYMFKDWHLQSFYISYVCL